MPLAPGKGRLRPTWPTKKSVHVDLLGLQWTWILHVQSPKRNNRWEWQIIMLMILHWGWVQRSRILGFMFILSYLPYMEYVDTS